MHTRIPLLCLSVLLAVPAAAILAIPAAAQTKPPAAQTKPPAASTKPPASAAHPPAAASNAPKELAKFDDWTAATHQEGSQTACYALTRVQSSTPTLPGRGEVVLTVTERATVRDTVAIEAGFDYAKDAAVTVQVDQTGLEFFTRERDAYARDGKAAVAAFQKAGRAIARSPGPKAQQVTDTFSLKGFSAAYTAIIKACPPPKG